MLRLNGRGIERINVVAAISARASTDEEAEALVRSIEIKVASSGTIETVGPEMNSKNRWQVNYGVLSPLSSDVVISKAE